MKCDPEMGKTAIQPLTAQTADSSISRLRFISPLCTSLSENIIDGSSQGVCMDSTSVPSAPKSELSADVLCNWSPPEAYAEFLGLLDYFADVAMKVSRSQTF